DDEQRDEVIDEDDSQDDSGVTTDMSEFSTDRQSVGSESNTGEYTLLGVTDSSNVGFHRFTFEISGKNEATESPHIIADYRASLGAIRLDLNGMTTDNSGIGYQQAKDINKDGVIRLYHNV